MAIKVGSLSVCLCVPEWEKPPCCSSVSLLSPNPALEFKSQLLFQAHVLDLSFAGTRSRDPLGRLLLPTPKKVISQALVQTDVVGVTVTFSLS